MQFNFYAFMKKSKVLYGLLAGLIACMCTSCFTMQITATLPPIAGSWEVISYRDIISENEAVVSDNTSIPQDRTRFTFQRNGTFIMQSIGEGFEYHEQGLWHQSGSTLIISSSNGQCMKCRMSISGNILMLATSTSETIDGATYRYTTELQACRL